MTTVDEPRTGKVVLFCSGISARYGKVRVVDDVTFSLHSGETLALLGPNGAGKTSLVGSLLGIVRGSGEITLNGHRIDSLPTHKRARRGLALVPEDRGLFADLPVMENLRLGARAAADPTQVIERVLGLFPILRDRVRQRAGLMSGGEQQMLAIAKAICSEPSVLILDEPTQGLAPGVFSILQEGIEPLKAEGMAVLLLEQNAAFAGRLADRIMIVRNGRCVREFKAEEVNDRASLIHDYL